MNRPPQLEVLAASVEFDHLDKWTLLTVRTHEGQSFTFRITPKMGRQTAIKLCQCFGEAIGGNVLPPPCLQVKRMS